MVVALGYFWQIIADLRVLGDKTDKITVDDQEALGR